jgi:hypothetical protein
MTSHLNVKPRRRSAPPAARRSHFDRLAVRIGLPTNAHGRRGGGLKTGGTENESS